MTANHTEPAGQARTPERTGHVPPTEGGRPPKTKKTMTDGRTHRDRRPPVGAGWLIENRRARKRQRPALEIEEANRNKPWRTGADRRDGDRTRLSLRRGHGPRRRRTADRRPISATTSKTWMVEPCRETALLPALVVSRQGDRWTNQIARHFDKAYSLAARHSLGVASAGSLTITELGR